VGVTASVYHPAGLSLLSKSVDQRGLRSATTGSGNLGIALGPLATARALLLAFDWRIVTAALTVPAAVVAAYGLTVDIDDDAS